MTDVVPSQVRSKMMASIRSRDTKPEMIVRRFLHGLGFRYRLSPRELPGKPDLILPRYRVAIFVHGCFWHGHHGCRFATTPATRTDFWMAKIRATKVRDDKAESTLRAMSWRIAVVWECALKLDRDRTLERVTSFIKSDLKAIDVSL